MAQLKDLAERQKQQWLRESWDGGTANEARLKELRAMHAALLQVATDPYEAWLKTWQDSQEKANEDDLQA